MNPETPALTEKHAHTNLIPNQAKENPLDPLYQLKIWMLICGSTKLSHFFI